MSSYQGGHSQTSQTDSQYNNRCRLLLNSQPCSRRRQMAARLPPPSRQRMGRQEHTAPGERSRSSIMRPEPYHHTSTPPILEVTENSSCSPPDHGKFPGHPKIQGLSQPPTEHSSLLGKLPRPSTGAFLPRRYSDRYRGLGDSSGDNDSCCSASDELSSNSSSSSFTSMLSSKQYLVLTMIMASSLSSSFTVCLFPPFYPRIAEMKGATATDYGLIIGTNCLVAFLVTPFIGNNIGSFGVKFAFVSGLLGGGVCTALSGFLEFFEPGTLFVVMSVLIRITHAVANALVITSTFTYSACEFPKNVAKIFSITRCVMNVAQLGGPILGGAIYEAGGFFAPFLLFGGCQIVLASVAMAMMPSPTMDTDEDLDCAETVKKTGKKAKKVSICAMLSIPTVWFSFAAFIIATMCNGFISITLEPQVLRNFNLTPVWIGLFFGLKDGANSLASPLWGWLCDRNKKSVKPYLVLSSMLVAVSFFLIGGGGSVGFHSAKLTLPILTIALCFNGAGIGGQQVSGVVDAMHEAAAAGYPDNPATHGLVAGLWSSLSGAGRFVSRGGTGFLVDEFGFDAVASIACGLQLIIGIVTFLYLVMCECSLVSRDHRLRSHSVTVMEQGSKTRGRDERVFNTYSSPSDTLMNHSVRVCIPGIPGSQAKKIPRVANSMPPKKWNNYADTPKTSVSVPHHLSFPF